MNRKKHLTPDKNTKNKVVIRTHKPLHTLNYLL